MKRMVVLGATSEIAIATLVAFAQKEPWHFILCGRNLEALKRLEAMPELANCQCELKYFDTSMSAPEQAQLWQECTSPRAASSSTATSSAASSMAAATVPSSSTDAAAVPSSSTDAAAVPLSTAASMSSATAAATPSITAASIPSVTTPAAMDAATSAASFSITASDHAVGTHSAPTKASDATAAQGHASLLCDESVRGDVDVLYCAVGYLGNQKKAELDVSECDLIMQANFNGLLPILSFAAQYFKQRQHGSIMVISSVAGERGRCSNYSYGASKAAMTAFLSGMRCSLLRSNVHVMTIKPGYVATRMVAHKKLPPYITASTQTVARDIVRGYERRSSVVYTMWLWRYIMAVVRLIPESIFKHLHMF